MIEPVHTILFDFDYTLADPSAWVFEALRTGLTAARLQVPNNAAMKRLIGIPLEEQYITLGGARTDDATYDRFKSAYVKYRDDHALSGTRIMPDVPDTLRYLNQTGMLLGIVSTGADTRIRHILAAAGLEQQFQSISGGWADKAEGIQASMHRLHSNNACVRYVGDRPDDAKAAALAQVGFIAVLTGAFTADAFPPGTNVMHSLKELPALLMLSAPTR